MYQSSAGHYDRRSRRLHRMMQCEGGYVPRERDMLCAAFQLLHQERRSRYGGDSQCETHWHSLRLFDTTIMGWGELFGRIPKDEFCALKGSRHIQD